MVPVLVHGVAAHDDGERARPVHRSLVRDGVGAVGIEPEEIELLRGLGPYDRLFRQPRMTLLLEAPVLVRLGAIILRLLEPSVLFAPIVDVRARLAFRPLRTFLHAGL